MSYDPTARQAIKILQQQVDRLNVRINDLEAQLVRVSGMVMSAPVTADDIAWADSVIAKIEAEGVT